MVVIPDKKWNMFVCLVEIVMKDLILL
jgi:hypothetical protein